MNIEEKLIGQVKKHPVLYKKSTRGYKNVSLKLKIWNKIAKNLSLTDEACQTKWRSLRDRFCKEYKKYSVGAAPNITSSSWEHWSNMIFLKDHIKHRQINDVSTDNTSDEFIVSTGEEEIQIDTEIDMAHFLNFKDPLESHSSKEKNIISKQSANVDIRSKLIETMKFFNSYLSKKTTIAPVQSSQTTTFCKVIGDIIESLQPSNQILAKSQILKLLSDMQLQEINVTT